MGILLYIVDNDLLHHIALTDSINHFQSFDYLTKYGVISIEMFSCISGVTDKKLRSASVPPCVGH